LLVNTIFSVFENIFTQDIVVNTKTSGFEKFFQNRLLLPYF